jgi:ribosomal protein S18 acetylase RimI-like enzyme
VSGCTVRRVRADEWREARALRLEALADPAAPVAFLETRTAAQGDGVVQVVAVSDDGVWVGTVTGLLEEVGTGDVAGGDVERRQVHLVAVYLDPAHRGRGLLGRLVDEAVAWAGERGADGVRLFVHTDNPRAQAAYRRLGFTETGRGFTSETGQELEMVLTR